MMQLDHEEPELRLALDEIVIDVRPRVGLAADVVRLGRRTRRRRRVAASLVAASVVGVGGYLSAGVLGDSGDGMMIVRPAVESPTATPSAQLSPTTAPAPQQHKSRTGSAPAAITAPGGAVVGRDGSRGPPRATGRTAGGHSDRTAHGVRRAAGELHRSLARRGRGVRRQQPELG